MDVEFTKSAEKELLKLSSPVAKRIYKKILELAQDPKQFKTEKLVGVDGFRIRVGDYRVIYTIEDKVLLVIRIRHRREVYKR